MSFVKEFKEFAVKGNVMDMAIGIIIGAAFGKIVTSFVNDIIMPPISYLTGANFTDHKLVLRSAADAVVGTDGTVVTPAIKEIAMTYGNFIQVSFDFLIIALVIFMMVKMINKMRKEEVPAPPAPKEDPADIVLLKEIRDALKK